MFKLAGLNLMTMLLKKSTFICILTIALAYGVVSSCKKKDNKPDLELKQPKGKLKSIKEGGFESVYFYNKEGQADYKSVSSYGSLVTKVQYVYGGGRLERSEYANAQADGSLKLIFSRVYQYQGSHFTDMVSVPGITSTNSPTLSNGKFTYDGSGKISTYAFWSPVDDPMYVQQFPVWQASLDARGNIIQLVTTNYDKAGNVLSTSKTTYEYDDKPNPRYLLGEPEDPLYFFSTNNMVSMTYESLAGAKFTEQYSYDYNTDGKPVKKYKTFHNVTSLVNEFSYY
jgi:hypothetical protein